VRSRPTRAGLVNDARFYVGHYEARTSPVADTNPATTGQNLDDRASFAPGIYEFVVHAPGYGHLRLRRNFAAGASTTVTAELPTNRASRSKGPPPRATARTTTS
jgi:extracellular elastinolytic metalloproteinase